MQKSTLFCNNESKENNTLLQFALVNNADFWAKHEKFAIIHFLNEIARQNDIRHAEKVLLYIIENLQKMPNMSLVFKNNFPLYMSKYNELVERLEDQAFRFSFKRLAPYCDLTIVQSVALCYPMSKVEPSFFEIGKKVWERFISEYNYPNDYDVVNRYISDEINRFITDDTHNHDDIAVILDSAPFRYSADNEDRRLFSAYHTDCFSFENIWNRVYLKAYAVTLLSDDDQTQFSYLQRIFIDLIKTIERRIKICTVHQLDTTTRDKHYLKLKKMLSSYGIKANDEHKHNYIISLLDRDTALIEEAAFFPMLEQIGDAIYGLAVAELLFYNPDNLFYPQDNYDPIGKNIAERFEKFTRAEAQVLISKKHKIDELYLQTGLPDKYPENDSIFFDYEISNEDQLQKLNQEKYLADTLEMIIGSIFIDMGINSALHFAKQLLKETYPKHFTKEVHIGDRKGRDEDIDWEFWSRILPGLYSEMSDAHHVIWNALNKVVLTISIGTDKKEKRRFITNSFGNTAIYEEKDDYGVSWPFYYYLHNGLDFVLQKYSDTIRENYCKNNNF
jgi:dsRNA-specific ribonuclease